MVYIGESHTGKTTLMMKLGVFCYQVTKAVYCVVVVTQEGGAT